MTLGVGIIGCGAVAQIVHLPALAQLADRFHVAALCDVNDGTLEGVAARWGVAARHRDHRELVARADVDVVLIAAPHALHAELAIAAMDAGKHVLIEKPVCLSVADADRLIAVAARTGVTAQVGYMRRHAPALREAAALLPDRAQIRRARVQDVIGQNALIVDSTSRVIRGEGAAAHEARALAVQAAAVEAVLGAVPPAVATAYMLLVGLASHDVSALRALIGVPQGVLYAAQRWGGRWVTAALDYGSFVCELALGVDQIGRMDAHIEVFAGTRVVRVEYDTPYVRNLPARLVVTEAHDGVGVTRSEGFATRQDTFVLEWAAFHDAIAARRTPETSLADARQDLVLFAQVAAALR